MNQVAYHPTLGGHQMGTNSTEDDHQDGIGLPFLIISL
jgi:hypothetical protein